MSIDASPRITLRPAMRADSRRLWEWRNDPSVRDASFHSAPIPVEDHERWFAAKLGDPKTVIYVVVTEDGRDAGYVRLDLEGEEALISTAIAGDLRGHGYGTAAIRAAAQAFQRTARGCRIVALIRPNNARSEGAFLKAGFVRGGTRRVGDVVAAMLVWPDA